MVQGSLSPGILVSCHREPSAALSFLSLSNSDNSGTCHGTA